MTQQDTFFIQPAGEKAMLIVAAVDNPLFSRCRCPVCGDVAKPGDIFQVTYDNERLCTSCYSWFEWKVWMACVAGPETLNENTD